MSSQIFIGSGNGNSAQAQQFFDRLLTPPTGQREFFYSSLIDGLVTDGTWAKLDGLYVFCSADEGAILTNLVSGSYRASYPTDPPAYTVDRFLSPQGSDTTITLNFNPFSAGGHYSQNSACLFGWNLASTSNSGWLIGTSTNVIELVPKDGTGHTLIALNSVTKDDLGTGVAADASGLWVANRTGATALTLDRNGVRIATLTTASVAPENLPLKSTAIAQVAFVGYGGALTDAQIANLYPRLAAFATGVGAI